MNVPEAIQSILTAKEGIDRQVERIRLVNTELLGSYQKLTEVQAYLNELKDLTARVGFKSAKPAADAAALADEAAEWLFAENTGLPTLAWSFASVSGKLEELELKLQSMDLG